MLVDGVITLLTTTDSVSSLLSDTTAVFRSVLPRGYALPAIAVHRYNGTEETDMAGPIGLEEHFVQLDVYGNAPEDTETVAKAVRAILSRLVGTLPDGTTVQGSFLERDMDMTFLAKADTKGIAYRQCLGYRIVVVDVTDTNED